MNFPTPFTVVNDILLNLLAQVQVILGEQFVGMYLYGSLALGDFDPLRSDIDFLVVTRRALEEKDLLALQAMHRALGAADSKWALELEGSYIPLVSLRRYNPGDTHHPHIDRGSSGLAIEQHDTDWVVQRHTLRRCGVVLSGPPLESLIDPISPDELRQAVRGLLWWWELQLADTHRIQQSDYQAYAVLSMCRILYTLTCGDVLSKPAALRWALSNLEERWTSLIECAAAWQPGQSMNRLDETLAFIRFTLAAARVCS